MNSETLTINLGLFSSSVTAILDHTHTHIFTHICVVMRAGDHGAAFSATPLRRSIDPAVLKHPSFLRDAAPTAMYVLYDLDRGVLCSTSTSKAERVVVAYRTFSDLTRVLELHLGNDGVEACSSGDGKCAPPYLLGKRSDDDTLAFVVDVTGCDTRAMETNDDCFIAVRELMTGPRTADDDTLVIVGLSHAIARWHASQRYCGYTGLKTAPIEGGLKRIAASNLVAANATKVKPTKLYPRVNPVAIMLVENDAGTHCLLGRYHRAPEGMYTCLAGFVETCERLEDACAREVFEESGVAIKAPRILNSQAWPVARGGHCELMVGMHAVAADRDGDTALPPVIFDGTEMEDVSWFSKTEVTRALNVSRGAATPTESMDVKIKTVPGPFALAHWLIARWVDDECAGAHKL